jgi:hypothetical protein
MFTTPTHTGHHPEAFLRAQWCAGSQIISLRTRAISKYLADLVLYAGRLDTARHNAQALFGSIIGVPSPLTGNTEGALLLKLFKGV